MSKKLYSVSGLFNSPDSIIHAAQKVKDEGYKKFDVHTPYPVHGMDAAMGLEKTKLGYVTLFFGFAGTTFALLLMFWTMSVDYPMVISGKPLFSLPAFGPVTFELTVLLATLSTVAGMLAVFFSLPYNAHPLHDSDYMKATSSDKYGLTIEAEDEKFDFEKVKSLLNSLGAERIFEIHQPEKETFPLYQPKFILFLLTVVIAVSGGTYVTLNKLMYVVPFDWMSEQARINVQSKSEFFADEFGMRKPVEGTVARGYMPYIFAGQPDPVNPLENPYFPTDENLALGKRKYNTFCSPCHGNFGDGDARLRGQFPNPPTLHSSKVREWKDGNIYHVITNGQNIMSSYASQITREERWAIVNYIRVLQRAKNASEEDIDFVKKESDGNVAN